MRPTRLLLAIALTTVALAGTGCASGAVHASSLQQAVGTTYQRLWTLQQQELGHDPAAPPDRAASCSHASSTTAAGPGSWTCTVHYPYADGHQVALVYDVEVQPTGCFTATGPATVIGQQRMTTPTGATVTNPLYAFDGCFALS